MKILCDWEFVLDTKSGLQGKKRLIITSLENMPLPWPYFREQRTSKTIGRDLIVCTWTSLPVLWSLCEGEKIGNCDTSVQSDKAINKWFKHTLSKWRYNTLLFFSRTTQLNIIKQGRVHPHTHIYSRAPTQLTTNTIFVSFQYLCYYWLYYIFDLIFYWTGIHDNIATPGSSSPAGHSLSWLDIKRPRLGQQQKTLVAKVWTPEDPRTYTMGGGHCWQLLLCPVVAT